MIINIITNSRERFPIDPVCCTIYIGRPSKLEKSNLFVREYRLHPLRKFHRRRRGKHIEQVKPDKNIFYESALNPH